MKFIHFTFGTVLYIYVFLKDFATELVAKDKWTYHTFYSARVTHYCSLIMFMKLYSVKFLGILIHGPHRVSVSKLNLTGSLKYCRYNEILKKYIDSINNGPCMVGSLMSQYGRPPRSRSASMYGPGRRITSAWRRGHWP